MKAKNFRLVRPVTIIVRPLYRVALFGLAWCGYTGITSAATVGQAARTLDLPATTIFSRGPNKADGEVLNITKGRGSNIGWYVLAKEPDKVTVTIQFSNAEPLNQAYQISFDGQDRFWEVPVTGEGKWAEATIGTFDLRGGVPVMVLLVPPSNKQYKHPVRFEKLTLRGAKPGNVAFHLPAAAPPTPVSSPGFGAKLDKLHPALTSVDLRPNEGTWRISGMALREKNELLFTTWDGDLFSFDLSKSSSRPSSQGKLAYRRIAQGLSEPMGLALTNGRIFVTEKNEVTELIDADGDGVIETYRCVSHDWPCSLDYHEYLFGAVIEGSYIYFSGSVAMGIRDSHNQQAYLRGSVFKVHLETGSTEVVAGGLRSPNGIGFGPKNEIYITDNQGEWEPGNKLVKLQPRAFYNFRSAGKPHPFDRSDPTKPTVWLPQGEIANSPTQPILLPKSWGPYAGQMLFGDVTYGGLQRVFLEDVDGVTQGAVFQFSQGFRHLFNRLEMTPDGTMFGGGIARGTNWDFIGKVSGLTQIRMTDKKAFEPLAVRLRSNGLELEFTQPLARGHGWDPAGYYVTQWGYQAVQTYGGPKVRHRRAEVRSASVSEDRTRVFLEMPGLVADEIVYVRLPETLQSAEGNPLWAGEAWYTTNRIPRGKPGKVTTRPADIAGGSVPYFRFDGADAGRTLYQNFCAACHSIDGSPLVGPSFRGIFGTSRKVIESGASKTVSVDKNYIRQSILEPNAQVVEGFQDIMPPLGATLSEPDIEALVEYVARISRGDGVGKVAR